MRHINVILFFFQFCEQYSNEVEDIYYILDANGMPTGNVFLKISIQKENVKEVRLKNLKKVDN